MVMCKCQSSESEKLWEGESTAILAFIDKNVEEDKRSLKIHWLMWNYSHSFDYWFSMWMKIIVTTLKLKIQLFSARCFVLHSCTPSYQTHEEESLKFSGDTVLRVLNNIESQKMYLLIYRCSWSKLFPRTIRN